MKSAAASQVSTLRQELGDPRCQVGNSIILSRAWPLMSMDLVFRILKTIMSLEAMARIEMKL